MMTKEEKAAKIRALVERLSLEEGLGNALTDEDVQNLVRRAFTQQSALIAAEILRPLIHEEAKVQAKEAVTKEIELLSGTKLYFESINSRCTRALQTAAEHAAREAVKGMAFKVSIHSDQQVKL